MNFASRLFAGAVIAASLSPGFGADSSPAAPEVQWADTGDNTPLHLAVLRGDADAVDALLAQGTDVTAVNSAGATPLLYATANERMVTALLAHGAPVNAVSKWFVTPLWAAVLHPDSIAVVRRLVEAGADIKYGPWKQTSLILNSAIEGGDLRTVEFLLEHGAEANPATGGLPLVTAAGNGDLEILKLLLARGAVVNCRDVATELQPLSAALLSGHYDVARLLVERGADVNVRLPFATEPTVMGMSAYNDALDPTVARLLVERGADINSTDDNGETALSYALKRGSDNPLVAYLREAGAKDSVVPRRAKAIPAREVPTDPVAREAMLRDSVQRAITLVQPSSKAFLQIPMVHDQQKCTSCHQQELPNVAIAIARERGLRYDEHELGRALHALKSTISDHTEGNRQLGTYLPNINPLVLGYVFDDLHAYGFERDRFTDALARTLLDFQCPDGHWRAPVRRPPMEDGPLVATAWGARALQLYPPDGRERDTELALGRARTWLAAQEPRDFNDRVFQLLGIAWTNETVERMRPLAEALVALQQPDGGWAQFPALECDSWATGTALVALHKAGIPTAHPAYQRGVTFLLRTQFDDGSWWVRSRTIPIQPQFNGRFPHGKDQWISASGTSWAMIALLLTLDPTFDPGELPTAKQLIASFASAPPDQRATGLVAASEGTPPAEANTGTIEFARDIQPIFERSCVGCHSGEQPKASLNLTTRVSLLKGGQNGEPAIVPGYADDSELFQFVSGRAEDLEMPPLNRRHKYPGLSPEEIDQLRVWIDAGAPWPEAANITPGQASAAGSTAPAESPGT